MKKSELKSIIKEEIKTLTEGNNIFIKDLLQAIEKDGIEGIGKFSLFSLEDVVDSSTYKELKKENKMKKSELKSLITEVIKEQKLNEAQEGYDMTKIGGGFHRPYVEMGNWGMKNIEVGISLYEGGSQKDFEVPLCRDLVAVVKKKDFQPSDDAMLYKIKMAIHNDVADAVVKNLKSFEKEVEKDVIAIIKKHNKLET